MEGNCDCPQNRYCKFRDTTRAPDTTKKYADHRGQLNSEKLVEERIQRMNPNKRSSCRNRRNPSYYGFQDSSPDSEIATPPKRPRRAGDVENIQPTNVSDVETSKATAEQAPDAISTSPAVRTVSPLIREFLP